MGTLIHGQAGQQVSPHAETPYGISRDISHVPACWASAHAPDPACGSRASVHVAPSLTFIQISPARHDRTVSFTSRLRTRLSPPITKPLLIPTRAHPPPIVLGYITLCCHRFCDTIALCRGNPKRNDTGACTANTASCAQSIKTPPRRWSSATHSSSLSPL